MRPNQEARERHHGSVWGHAHRDGWDYLCADEMKDWAVALIAAVCITAFVVWSVFIIFWAMK
jgi:hypothetical protein